MLARDAPKAFPTFDLVTPRSHDPERHGSSPRAHAGCLPRPIDVATRLPIASEFCPHVSRYPPDATCGANKHFSKEAASTRVRGRRFFGRTHTPYGGSASYGKLSHRIKLASQLSRRYVGGTSEAVRPRTRGESHKILITAGGGTYGPIPSNGT